MTGDYVERPWFSEVHDGLDSHRNGCIVAHRRGGKTVGMVAQGVRETFREHLPGPQGAYIAPTAKQAKDVAWHYFVDMLKDVPGVEFRRHTLEIELPLMAGQDRPGRILLASGDKYDRLRGMYLDWAIVDEGADCPEALIPTVLLPALEDRLGKLWLIGTVRGRNWFWQQYEKAMASSDWFAGLYAPSSTGVFTDEQLEFLRQEMGDDAYRQEMLCDPTAASRGAYFARELAEHKSQQTTVPYDAQLGVTVSFDLGIADATAVWFTQVHGAGEIRHIEYREYVNTGFIDILRELQRLDYVIDRWIGPHDLAVREYSSGQSRLDAARSVGVNFEVAPRLPVIDGIEAVRRALPRMWFDADKCRDGLIALEQYHSQYDEKRRVLSRNPVHDWSSHGADAMRAFVTASRGGQAKDLFADMAPLEYNAELKKQGGSRRSRVNTQWLR